MKNQPEQTGVAVAAGPAATTTLQSVFCSFSATAACQASDNAPTPPIRWGKKSPLKPKGHSNESGSSQTALFVPAAKISAKQNSFKKSMITKSRAPETAVTHFCSIITDLPQH